MCAVRSTLGDAVEHAACVSKHHPPRPVLVEELFDEWLSHVFVTGKKCMHAFAQGESALRQETLELSSLLPRQRAGVDEAARARRDLAVVACLFLVLLEARIAGGVEQAKPSKMVGFAELFGCCRQEQEPGCGARQSVDELVGKAFALQMMSFVLLENN